MPQPTQGGSQPPPKQAAGASWLKRLKDLAPFLLFLGVVGGAYQFGVSVGKDRSSELKEFYQAKISELERQRREIQGRLNQAGEAQAILRRDLADCQRHAGGNENNADSMIGNQVAGTVRVQILVGETAEVFRSQLTITVREISPFPAPPSYRAVVVLGSPGLENLVWEARAGDKTAFAGAEVRMRSVDAASAFFSAQRPAGAAPSSPP